MKTIRLSHWSTVSSILFLLAGVVVVAAPPAISQDYFKILWSGEVNQLRKALDQGFSANAHDAQGNTPLILAAAYGDASCMRLLIERGAAINAANAAGATALIRASCNYEKTRLLLEHHASVNARSALGNTALMLAARPWNSHRTVESLSTHGADARATSEFGANALMAASAGGDARTVRLLLKHGADPNAQPGASHADFILGGGRSPLMWAAYRGDLAVLKRLIDAGADLNSEAMLATPLSQAAWADQTAAVRFLMD